MSIITISRGAFSGGQALAERVAERLGYRCVSREQILAAAARTYSYPTDKLVSEMDKVPSFWERLAGVRSQHLVYVRPTLLECAQQGPMVYHGYVGHLHLTGLPNVLRVRVTEDFDYRVNVVMHDRNVSRDDALAQIKKADSERRDWVRFLFGVEWDDPTLYDLVLNIGRMSLETACDVVVQVAEREEFSPTAQSWKTLNDLLLATRISATIAADPRTIYADIEVSANSGVVTLEGVFPRPGMAETVLTVVREVEGVTNIRNELTTTPPEQYLGGS